MSLDFFPFTSPSNREKIVFPTEDLQLESPKVKRESKRKEKKPEKIEITFDLDKVTLDSSKKSGGYNIQELKGIAKNLKIKGASTMKRAELVKFIKLKVNK